MAELGQSNALVHDEPVQRITEESLLRKGPFVVEIECHSPLPRASTVQGSVEFSEPGEDELEAKQDTAIDCNSIDSTGPPMSDIPTFDPQQPRNRLWKPTICESTPRSHAL